MDRERYLLEHNYGAFLIRYCFGIKSCVFIVYCLFFNTAIAVDTAMFDVGKITGTTWNLEEIKLSLGDLNNTQPQFLLLATKLKFPKPFNNLSLADIRCDNLTWTKDSVDCRQGKASVKSGYWQSLSTDFTFHLSPKLSIFRLANARIADSRLALNAQLKGKNWQVRFEADQINQALLEKLLPLPIGKAELPKLNQGRLKLSGIVSGVDDKLQSFDATAQIQGLTGQKSDGKVAVEKLNLLAHFQGVSANGLWHWQAESQMLGGGLYADPIYLEVVKEPIVLTAQGTTNPKTTLTHIQTFSYQHPGVVRVSGGSALGFHRNKLQIETADIVVQSDALQGLFTTYLKPFFAEPPLANANIDGNLEARLSIVQQALTAAAVNFTKLNIEDESGRLMVKNGLGSVNWSANTAEQKSSAIAWQALSINRLPFDAAALNFSSRGNAFQLAEKVKLPLLDGVIAVDKFSWQAKPNEEPEISFSGSLDHLALEKLSKTLGWTPLSGDISGYIPGIEYRNKTLSLGGELLIKVFDGTIKIGHLSSSGLFSGFPRLDSDIEIDNLDLDQLTQKFEFGNITGRLSGYIKNLKLENWRPVSFYAWLGTPDDDDSSHKISQKAVKNIANIGGGGASDLLSRSFLSFFETFHYDKIGIGCYLHDGVCQMMGLEAEGQGYYLIKGGLLPRIDVLSTTNHTDFNAIWSWLTNAIKDKNYFKNMKVEQK